jgi:hypothetical protein
LFFQPEQYFSLTKNQPTVFFSRLIIPAERGLRNPKYSNTFWELINWTEEVIIQIFPNIPRNRNIFKTNQFAMVHVKRDGSTALYHSCEFHSGTARNVSYRSLNRYRTTPIPYRFKYQSMPVNTGQIPANTGQIPVNTGRDCMYYIFSCMNFGV